MGTCRMTLYHIQSTLRHLRIGYPGAEYSLAVTSFNKTYFSLTTKHQTPQ